MGSRRALSFTKYTCDILQVHSNADSARYPLSACPVSEDIGLTSSPTWFQRLHHMKQFLSVGQLRFSLVFGKHFNFSTVSLFSFQKNAEMRHLKFKDCIWSLPSFSTASRMGTTHILADSKRTYVPWWRFHIMSKIIHCPAASYSLLSPGCQNYCYREIHPWSGMKCPFLFNGKLHSLQEGSAAQDPELMMLSGLFCRQKNPTSIFIGIFLN